MRARPVQTTIRTKEKASHYPTYRPVKRAHAYEDARVGTTRISESRPAFETSGGDLATCINTCATDSPVGLLTGSRPRAT